MTDKFLCFLCHIGQFIFSMHIFVFSWLRIWVMNFNKNYIDHCSKYTSQQRCNYRNPPPIITSPVRQKEQELVSFVTLVNTFLWSSHWTDPVVCHLLYCWPFYFVLCLCNWVTPSSALPGLVLIEMINIKHQTCCSVCCTCILENKAFLVHVYLGTEDDFSLEKSTFHWLAVKWTGTYLLNPSNLHLCCPQMLVNRFSGCCKSGLFHLHGNLQVHTSNSIYHLPLGKCNKLNWILSIFTLSNVIKHSDCKVDYPWLEWSRFKFHEVESYLYV